jgi:hypothetical protein
MHWYTSSEWYDPVKNEQIQNLPQRIREHLRVIDGEPMYVFEYEGEEQHYALDSGFVAKMIVADRIIRLNEEVLRRLAKS